MKFYVCSKVVLLEKLSIRIGNNRLPPKWQNLPSTYFLVVPLLCIPMCWDET